MKYLFVLICIFSLSTSSLLAQEKLKLELKDAPKPHIYIDGKKYDHAIFDLLDQDKIESISVIKGEQALKEYNAPHGVIIVKSKKAENQIISIDADEIKLANNDKDPVIVIDGKVSSKLILSSLSPDDIESVNVLKGQKALDQYKAINGVVIVKTKK